MTTAAERTHLDRVARLGCLICGARAEVHHIRTGQGLRRASHFETIPLCPTHHRTGGHGIAFHAGREIWERTFGTELELLAQVRAELSREEPHASIS